MKLKYGEFLDRHISRGDDWDSLPIGAHAAINNAIRKNNETVGFEYYYINDGQIYIIDKPTILETVTAIITKKNSKGIVGYRNTSIRVENTEKLKELLKTKEENYLSR